MTGPNGERRFRPVSDTVVALLAASVPFLDLYTDLLLQPAGSPYSLITAIAAALVIGSSLLVRRRAPVLVLGVQLLAAVVLTSGWEAEFAIPFLVGAWVALFTVASLQPRRSALLAGVVTAAVGIAIEVVARTDAGPLLSLGSLDGLLPPALAVAAGDAVRTRRIYVQVLEERARRAEETREREARARVSEERLRIARELHDIVAHHITVVNIQAGLAERALSRDALATASTAIGHVANAACLALDDLSTVLRLLREPGDVDDREPAPGLEQVNDLLSSYTDADNRVQVTIRGQARPLHATTELTAYRVIQESLTNASKHGVLGEAHLTLSYEPAEFVVHVTNSVRDDAGGTVPTALGTGYGMIGMRERVAAVGGRMTAGRAANGDFVVDVHVPYAPTEPAQMESTQ